jgi:hypothetical protein
MYSSFLGLLKGRIGGQRNEAKGKRIQAQKRPFIFALGL